MVEDIMEMEKSGQVCTICIDFANSKSVKEAFEAVNSLGPVEALGDNCQCEILRWSVLAMQVYNANTPFPWPPPKFTEINAESFECSITIPCVGAFSAFSRSDKAWLSGKKAPCFSQELLLPCVQVQGFSGLGAVFFLSLVSLPSNEPPFSQIFRVVFYLSVYHWEALGKFLVGNLH